MRIITLSILLLFSIQAITQSLSESIRIFHDPFALSYRKLDLNNDGLMDIVSYDHIGTQSEGYLNEGNFQFRFLDLSRGENNYGITNETGFVDADGDGFKDLVNDSGSDIFLYKYDVNTRKYNRAFSIVNKFGGFDNLKYINGDFNNDGFDDLVIGSTNAQVFSNDQNGKFRSPYILSPSLKVAHLQTDDFNKDGYLDIIMFTTTETYIFINNNGTDFLEGIKVVGSLAGSYIDERDINGDGIKDYYVTNGNCLKIMYSDLAEPDFYGTPYNVVCGTAQETKYTIIDYNHDGLQDVVSGRIANDGIQVRINNGNGFDAPLLVSSYGLQNYKYLVDDFNNDGFDDLVYSDKFHSLNVLDFKDNAKIFNHVIGNEFKIELAALNNDLESDMVLFTEDFVCISYYEERLKGYGSLKTLFNFNGNVNDIDFADMDHDGDIDLIILASGSISTMTGAALLWAENVDGDFSTVHPISGQTGMATLSVSDFNKDSYIDIIIHPDSGTGFYLLNNGDNTFTSSKIYATGFESQVVDMNDDGFLDVLTWNLYRGTIHYIQNDKNGGFLNRQLLLNETNIYDVIAVKNEGNGWKDLITLSSKGDLFAKIFRTDGNGGYDNGTMLSGSYPGSSLAKFYNKDGKIQILTSGTLQYFSSLGVSFKFEKALSSEYFGDLRFNHFTGSLPFYNLYTSGGEDVIQFTTSFRAYDRDNDGYTIGEDCDDNNSYIHPYAMEIGNNDIDENCDGLLAQYEDVDGDGYHVGIDCNDLDSLINPGATEIPGNGIDENCDGLDIEVFLDIDGDGFTSDMDCNDANASIFPGQVEYISNAIDDNCDNDAAEQIFGNGPIYPAFNEINDYLSIDADGDGKNEMIYASDFGVVTRKIPSNQFKNLVVSQEKQEFVFLEKGDIDGDADYDLVFYSYLTGSIGVLKNNNGVWADYYTLGEKLYVTDLELADINNDGFADIVFTNQDGTNPHVGIYFGNISGTFSSVEYNEPTLNFVFFQYIKVFDFNKDGNLDIVFGGIGLKYLPGNGDGTFGAEVTPSASAQDRFNTMIPIIWDNREALLYSYKNYLKEQIKIIFLDDKSVLTISDSLFVREIKVADINNDCLDDILFLHDNKLDVLLQNDMKTYRIQDNLNSYSFFVGPLGASSINSVAFANENNDQLLHVYLNILPLADQDGDGFDQSEDCNDCDALINAAQVEIIGNGKDDNCNGYVDEVDNDNDGFFNYEDCDDTSADINPNAIEIEGNGIDDNCDGIIDIVDNDGDGFDNTEDCNDSDPDINPNAIEIEGNGIDDDCDGLIDVFDLDMDGYASDIDCDDLNAEVYPGNIEIPDNGLDDDCINGDSTEYEYISYAEAKRVDADGFSVNSEKKVIMAGVVHGINFLELSSNYLASMLNQNGEGIYLFAFDYPFSKQEPIEGDSVEVYGSLLFYNGITQLRIHHFEVLKQGITPYTPIDENFIGDDNEASLIRIRNCEFVDLSQWKSSGSSFNMLISDGTLIFDVRIDNDSELSRWKTPPTGSFDVVGFSNQFDATAPYTEAYQLMPRYINDFQIISSSNDAIDKSQWSIYPNPIHNMLYIKSDKSNNPNGVIVNQLGQQVLSFDTKEIDVANLASGIYFVKIDNEVKRFVKG